MISTDLEVVPGHIETPNSIELKASAVASSCIGAWSLWPIVKDTVFGPFVGDIKKGKDIKDINYRYAWEVFDPEMFGLLHVIDATDPSKGNWMRYVNCARYLEEQNLISVQQEDKVYYKAIKNIAPGEELLTWFEPRKKKRQQKRKMEKEVKEEKVSATTTDPSDARYDKDDDSLGKRKRKPKVFPYSYQEIWLPCQKKLNKVQSSDCSQSETSTNMVVKQKRKNMKESSDELKESKDDTESATSSRCSSVIPEKRYIFNNNSVSWDYPKPGEEYMFELKKHHVVKVEGKQSYKCDICSGLYRHTFSLKRHYLKNHINYRYLGRADVTNCLINLAQVLEAEKAAIKRKEFEELSDGKENCSSNNAASDIGVASSVNSVSLEGDNSTDFRSSNDDLQLENKGSKDSEIARHPGLYRCYLCFEHFETVAEIREHTVNHPEFKTHMTFACNKCEMKFSYIQNLVRHQAVHQANGSELINQSKKLLPGKGVKKMRTTTRKDKLVDKNTDIEKEEERKEEKKNDKCRLKECTGKDQKGKSSPKKKYQKGKSSAEKKYHCSRCREKFGSLQNLLRHQEVHKDEKKTSPHSCEYCGKGFKLLTNLKKHVQLHLGFKMNCFHQRKYHDNKSRHRSKASNSARPVVTETPEMVAMFYANVANNIAINMTYYIDGGQNSLQNCTDHIRIEDYHQLPTQQDKSAGLESATEQDTFHCTGCGSVFDNVSNLHVHIVNCVSTSKLNII
ncbi:hypothetical protein ACJMK2_007738 [Sinanodonta woodiana]|uniref:Uncharacterized protein n=1 Tax=Sinanodonta woodiana TaxID=1069815 RepID=A0ABD3VJE5_SINWO